MIESSTPDLYRSYRAVDLEQGGDAAAALFVARYLLPLLAPLRQEPVLEIGAGTGGTLRALRAAGFLRATGVDTSPSQVERARSLGTDVELGDGLAALAARPSGSLGAVVLLDVLEHLALPELLGLLEAAADRLRPGGLLVARAPNGEGLFGGAILYGDLTHQRAYTRRSLMQAFALCGLQVRSVQPVRPMVHGVPSALRAAAWALVEVVLKVASAAESGAASLIVTRNLLAVARRAP